MIGGTGKADRPIGVFDSGVGGLSVLRALRAALPAEDFTYLADTGFAPYGERGDAYVIDRTRTVIQRLREGHDIKALVIACNTATAAAIHLMRVEHADLPIVGVEPALKPAVALSKTGRVGVMATRGTLSSAKFTALLASLDGQADFALQPCDGLADAIQNADAQETQLLCDRYTRRMGRFGAAPGAIDTLVLGCTHYPFASDVLQALTDPVVRLVETGEPVARQTRRLLEADGRLQANGRAGRIELLSTGSLPQLQEAAARWLSLRG